MNLGRIILK